MPKKEYPTDVFNKWIIKWGSRFLIIANGLCCCTVHISKWIISISGMSMLIKIDITIIIIYIIMLYVSMPTGHLLANCFLCSDSNFVSPSFGILKLSSSSMLNFSVKLTIFYRFRLLFRIFN